MNYMIDKNLYRVSGCSDCFRKLLNQTFDFGNLPLFDRSVTSWKWQSTASDLAEMRIDTIVRKWQVRPLRAHLTRTNKYRSMRTNKPRRTHSFFKAADQYWPHHRNFNLSLSSRNDWNMCSTDENRRKKWLNSVKSSIA